MPDLVPIRRALLSVSNKHGLGGFARSLSAKGIDLISTGGTAAALQDAGIPVQDVSAVTGFPEIMDGRVKTLHPKIHGALLSIRGNDDHESQRLANDIALIDLLVVNLYPFEAAVGRNADFDEVIENIDIGGPAMIRAAAKNHSGVTVVVDPDDYDGVLEELEANGGGISARTRRRLAAKAFSRTASYDAAVSTWFQSRVETPDRTYQAFGGTLLQTLRYGENPHQSAAFYKTLEQRPGVASAKQVQGKELSYNNINDTDAAFECVAELGTDRPAVVIVKHANPCGVAMGDRLSEAFERALRCDPVSAFGGIIALNQKMDAAVAEQIAQLFSEVVIAPAADASALSVLAAKKNVRVLLTGGVPDPLASGLLVKSVAGGLLVQSRDNARPSTFQVVTKKGPTPQEEADLKFAFSVCKHVKSNAIVYAKDGATVGIGAGQMSRVDSARIAAHKASEAAKAAGMPVSLSEGSVVASDAFFPFADGLLAAIAAGATAVIQPGGSVRDAEVIAAADEAGIAMVFTGIRHFRH
ncbi:phosphoribosylaminoimidazolecarboxamide formyltransferase/IMP cyclohydrolase [Rhodoligotrophos appendicifer]|uniref:bifunctional phosphoribosylaminoimidazolecarboxamide formyltransferase/IMP cyclohydrolase n=1 Tax=Rhodoligotrophos appendicifer TaxID=987056 RepID=UPI00118695E8|nr:bifunctional phosphoribosylaminoimidazolecarboxamide formyltransferase/IMP cyclohydrolase [Rhodoligotrophos appendicifer]